MVALFACFCYFLIEYNDLHKKYNRIIIYNGIRKMIEKTKNIRNADKIIVKNITNILGCSCHNINDTFNQVTRQDIFKSSRKNPRRKAYSKK